MKISSRIIASIFFLHGILIFLFWMLFAFLLPMTEPYVNWLLDADWIWVNSIGFIGSSLGIFVLAALYYYRESEYWLDMFAFVLASIGVICLTGLLFFEAYILKGIALINPDLIVLNQGFYDETSFRLVNLIGGICFSTGFIIVGINMIKDKTFKRWKLILLIIGAPLFGNVFVPGNFRLIGVLLYVVAFISMAFELFAKKNRDD